MAALRLGLKQHTLPGTLYPSLEHGKDQSILRTLGCMESADRTQRSNNCIFGDKTGSRIMWLIGDSHANEWFFPVNAWAKTHGYQLEVHAKPSCVLHTKTTLRREYKNCDDINTYWQVQAAKVKPDLVVVGMYSGIVDLVLPNTLAALTKIAKHAGRLVVIEDSPKRIDPAPLCLRNQSSDIAKCSTPIKKAVIANVVTSLRRWVAKTPNARYLPTRKWFCLANECPAVIQNVLVYGDQNHVTGYMATWLTKLMDAAMTSAAN